MVIAYLSVGTDREQLDIQSDKITKFVATKENLRVDKWVTDVTGEKAKKIGRNLKETLDRLNKDDILIVSDITCLCRSVFDMMQILSVCMTKRVSLWCIEDRYIFDSSMNCDAMAEAFLLAESIDHALISMRTKDALIELKHAGKVLGRPKGSDSKQLFLDSTKEEIISMLERGESVSSICKYYGVSKNTFYKFKKNYSL